MSTRIQRRGGTAAQHETFTGAPREITVDTTNNNLRLHDGATAGGHPVFMARDGGLLGGFRNKIINGDFEIWQRGTAALTATGYSADRWLWRPATSSNSSVTKGTFSVGGEATIPGNPKNYIYLTKTVGGTESCYLEQRIEGVETLAGQEVTVTAYVRPDAATNINVLLVQYFGSGGTPSGTVYTTAVNTTSYSAGAWRKIQAKVVVPSVSGKTLGSGDNDYLALRFGFDPTAAFTARIAHVSLVAGDATAEDDPFSPRHINQEIELCQRYYEKSYDLETAPGSASGNGVEAARAAVTGPLAHRVTFKKTKRASPTITAYSTQGPAGYVRDSSLGDVASSGINIGENGYEEYASVTDGHRILWHWTADAEI